jgi:fructose/tagatose bisphosphate aldolase
MPVADYKTYCKMLDRARAGRFAFPAINVTSLTTANAVLRGLAESKSTPRRSSNRAQSLHGAMENRALRGRTLSAAASESGVDEYVCRRSGPTAAFCR